MLKAEGTSPGRETSPEGLLEAVTRTMTPND